MAAQRSREPGVDAHTIEGLRKPAAYPPEAHADAGIELVQTHISWVFLTPTRVYKLRKPVKLGFVDFSTREARNEDCLREIVLNRRLAPDVYLGLAPVLGHAEHARFGALGESLTDRCEHAVVMRRLDETRNALSLLQRRLLTVSMLHTIADHLAAFHARSSLGRPAPWPVNDWLERIVRPVEDNFATLLECCATIVSVDQVREAREAARAFFDRQQRRFAERRELGCAVDGHGDLHLAHVWPPYDGEPLRIIDCLEFNEDLRRIDAAADIAFLAMDLGYREAPRLGEVFLSAYAHAADDHHLYTVIDYYIAYRAGVRAKVAAIAASDPQIDPAQRASAAASARRHLLLATAAFRRKAAKPVAAVLCGVVGSGKSTVAHRIADTTGAVLIASDRLRRRLHQRLPAERRYRPDMKRAVYAEMLRRACDVLESGRNVVLDATFDSRDLRRYAAETLSPHAREIWLVGVRAAQETIRTRLVERTRDAESDSEAGPDQLQPSLARFEPPLEWDVAHRFEIDTSTPNWEHVVDEWARRTLA